MKRDLKIAGLDCLCTTRRSDRITYILYPLDMLNDWVEGAAMRFGTTIAVITGMDWQNVFSPWPAAGVPEGTPDFLGESPEFLKLLQSEVLPGIERVLGVLPDVDRTLVGVSMSGLFTLWQWMLCDTFRNIASLSGSFWYEGFMEWFKGKRIPRKPGKAFFLLGQREPQSKVSAFAPVGTNTLEIVSSLESAGINTSFEWVPGDHFADPVPRLNAALEALRQM